MIKGRRPAVELTRSGFVDRLSPARRRRLRDEFRRKQSVRLPRFLEPELVDAFNRALAKARFAVNDGRGRLTPDHRLMAAPTPRLDVLQLIFSDPALFRFVSSFIGGPPIESSGAQFHRMPSGRNYYLGWHQDLSDGRSAGLTIALNDRPFRGGQFQLRARSTERLLRRATNRRAGDALLFRLGAGLQHRSTRVTGPVEKRTINCFFMRPGGAAASSGPIAKIDLSAAARLKHADHVTWRRFAARTVIVDTRNYEHFSLNEPGGVVWQRLARGCTVEQAARQLSRRYDVSQRVAARDVRELVSELARLEAVTASPAWRPKGSARIGSGT